MYFNFMNYSVEFDPETMCFSMISGLPETGTFAENAGIAMETAGKREIRPADFASAENEYEQNFDFCVWKRVFRGGPADAPEAAVGFRISADGIVFFAEKVRISVAGHLCWGKDMEHATFSIRQDSAKPRLRTASGPAVHAGDDALFDRLTDRLLAWSAAGEFRLSYDWNAGKYAFRFTGKAGENPSLSFHIRNHYCAEKFHIPYAPINKNHGFDTPPVGWMTWYSVKFDASEEIVLDNARKFREAFGNYTPKMVMWVDWEWYHKALDGLGEEGADVFHPRKSAYPHGLQFVADELKKLGFIPALWIGATNEGRKNAMLEAHPEWILGQKALWCGQWWIDPSNPEVLEQYIPAVFRQIPEWHYEVVKWDCFPSSIKIYCEFHDRFYDRSVTPAQAFRNLVLAARKVLGNDVYLLSCSGVTARDVCGAMDLFNAARIGEDIFSWKDFLAQGIGQTLFAYPWHNTVLYTDADNLVLRKEHSNLEQARSRVSFYGLAGLAVTVGDEISALDDKRIDMLRRIMPVADVHPTELEHHYHGEHVLVTSLAVARPFGTWTVAGVTNLGETPRETVVDLQQDLDLEKGQYAVYDYWNGRFLGIFEDRIAVELKPFDTAVLRVTPVGSDLPEVVSVSRHITQGGVELQALERTKNSISGRIQCVANEPCIVTVLLPEGAGKAQSKFQLKQAGRIVELTLRTGSNEAINWELTF